MRAYALYIHASRPSVPVMAMQCAFTAVLRVGIRVGLPRPLSLTYAPCCARHEGEGSVFAVLKARGWAVELSAGESGMSFSAASLFSVNIVLTDEGVLPIARARRFDYATCTADAAAQRSATVKELASGSLSVFSLQTQIQLGHVRKWD
jgi:hypothetical protein